MLTKRAAVSLQHALNLTEIHFGQSLCSGQGRSDGKRAAASVGGPWRGPRPEVKRRLTLGGWQRHTYR